MGLYSYIKPNEIIKKESVYLYLVDKDYCFFKSWVSTAKSLNMLKRDVFSWNFAS